MRLFYKFNDRAIEVIDQTQIKVDLADVQALVDAGAAILYDTHDALEATIAYQSNRRNDYPAMEEQFDQIYHEGIDAWKETIKAVKDANPKPE